MAQGQRCFSRKSNSNMKPRSNPRFGEGRLYLLCVVALAISTAGCAGLRSDASIVRAAIRPAATTENTSVDSTADIRLVSGNDATHKSAKPTKRGRQINWQDVDTNRNSGQIQAGNQRTVPQQLQTPAPKQSVGEIVPPRGKPGLPPLQTQSVPYTQRPTARSDNSLIPPSPTSTNASTYSTRVPSQQRPVVTRNSAIQKRSFTVQQASAVLQDEDESQIPPPPPVSDGAIQPYHIPLEGDDAANNVSVTVNNGRVSLVTRNAPVQSVLNILAQQQGVNLVTSDDISGNVSVSLSNVSFEDALNSIVAIAGCTWTQQRGIILVTRVGINNSSQAASGSVVEVFPLNFVSALDVEATVKGLLSPMGQVFISQYNPTDKRRTQEQVVVEDVPASVARIAQFIAAFDQPPRQVLIEASILQVELDDDCHHGVNWSYLSKIAGSDVGLKTVGFANPLASPASILSIDGNNLDVLIEALKTTNDTKTLASPKIFVANGQEARIQIGQKLGYFVTTTTQTSTLQNVNFLNTGVVMRVTPQISNDGRVVMAVRPEVSTGKISAAGLPETQTTEAETTVMMNDGGGMVIGGLMKETDIDSQDKIPILGDLWLIGRAFQRRTTTRQRSEIIIVLIPRIVPYGPEDAQEEQREVAVSQVPLFHNGLQETPRPWEAKLPDAMENPRRLSFPRLRTLFANPYRNDPAPLRYYFPTRSDQ